MSLDVIHNKKLEWARAHPSACLFPYNALQVRQSWRSEGEMSIRCCCNLDINEYDLSKNVDPFFDLKQSMAQGELPILCNKCITEEANGGQSERIRSLLSVGEDDLEEFVATKKIKGFDFMVVFSNVCNLSCRSCEPTSSTMYSRITRNHDTEYLQQDITDIDSFWSLITNTILEKIYQQDYFDLHLMGGESLIQPGLEKLFDWLIEKDLAKDITLKLTTALTANLTDKLVGYFKQFKFVRFNLSIDSVGNNYHYVRWPAQFSKIERNVNHIVDTLEHNKFGCSLDPVFSLNNIFYIDDYLDYWYNWFEQTGQKFEIINTNLTTQTNLIDIQALPIRYRSTLEQKLKQCLNHAIFKKYSRGTLHLYGFITSTISELKTWPNDEKLWNRFLKHTAEFDRRTNTKFSVLNSRLYDLLEIKDRDLFDKKLNLVDINSRYQYFIED
jgi:hypothetical protein